MRKEGKSNQIDMLHGPMLKKILLFALPLVATSMLQQLFNSTDAAVVGRFAGPQALAAVGSNAALVNIIVTLFVGLSIGANVVIAKYIGQGREEKINRAVHTAMVVAFFSGIIIMAIGFFSARFLLVLIDTPEDVIDLATLYLKIIFCGMPFMMIYNFGSSVLRSKGDTKRPLYALAFSGVINVALNLFLVIKFEMSVAGVAIATVTSNLLSAVIILYLLFHEEGAYRLEWKKLKIDTHDLGWMIRIGIPAGLQGMVFSISNVVIQSAINSFGSDCVAGSAAALNFEFFAYFVVNSFAQTAVTFTSQNYGARNAQRCKKIFVRCMALGIIGTVIVDYTFFLSGEYSIRLFTTDPEVIPYAYIRMSHVLTVQLLANTYEIAGSCLRGMGHSLLPAAITIFGSCILRIIWVYTVFAASPSFERLLTVYPVSWIITGTAVITTYLIVRKKEFMKFER